MTAVKRAVDAMPFAKWDAVFLAGTYVKSAPIHLASYGVGVVDLVPAASLLICFATISFDHCYMNFIQDGLFYDIDQGTFLDVSWTKLIHTLVK